MLPKMFVWEQISRGLRISLGVYKPHPRLAVCWAHWKSQPVCLR